MPFNYRLNVGFALAFYFYLLISFLIGFISISVGYLYPVYLSETQLGLIAFLPLIFFILLSFYSQKIPYLYFVAPIFWYGSIIAPIMILKYFFILVGLIFTLLTLVELLQIVNGKTIDPRTFTIALIFLDQVVKGVNQGEYPISHASIFALGLITFLTIFVIIFLRDFMKVLNTLNVEEHVSKTNSWSTFPLFFGVFLLIFLFANNGILSFGNNLDLNTAIMLTTLATILLPLFYYIARDFLIQTKQMYIGLTGSLIIIIVLIFYPWFNFQVLLWLIGIVALAMILHTSVDSFTYKNKKSLIAFVTVSYFLITILLMIILLNELYIFYETFAFLILLGFSVKNLLEEREQEENIFHSPGKLFFGPLCEFFKAKRLALRYSLVILITVVISTAGFLPSLATINQPSLPSTGIRAMTYNLHFGQNNSGSDNIEAVAKLVSSIGPNFVSFEEVTFNSPVNGYSNMFGKLKNLLGPIGYKYNYHTTGTPAFLTNAFFSIYPIVNASTINLLPKAEFYRTALNIVLDLGSGKYLRVVQVHLTSVIENASNPDRIKQGELILATLSVLHSKIPTIILGDFNSFPTWPETTIFSSVYQDAWNTTHPSNKGYTWPSYGPANQRIDYIFVDKSIPITSCSITNNLPISDHNALYCNLNY